MPVKVNATELRGKPCMSDEGLMLGRIENVLTNIKTGDLEHLLVTPSDEIDPRLYKRDNSGNLVFPFGNVASVRDVVVVKTR